MEWRSVSMYAPTKRLPEQLAQLSVMYVTERPQKHCSEPEDHQYL